MGEVPPAATIETLMAFLQQSNQSFNTTLNNINNRMDTMQTDFGTFRTRLDQLDPPNQNAAPRAPIRNAPPAARREDPDPQQEEEPPDIPPQPQYDPIRNAFEQVYRRNQGDRNRPREDERVLPPEVKLTAPTFAGKIDPAAYLEWEKRMEHLFEYYAYTEPKKIALAIASLTDHALAWWDRESAEKRRLRYPQITRWNDMKLELRRRYVPPHFHRELLKRFRSLYQGTRSVEEYYEEFEMIRSRLELEETEESLMSQFVEGLQDRIQRKVEMQPYHSLQEVLYLAIQRENQIKKKTSTRSRNKDNSWTQPQPSAPSPTPPPQVIDKGKSISIDSRFKSNDYRAEQGKSSNSQSQRSRDIVCYKCQGRGHMARDCPNKRVMILTDAGYDSQDEAEATSLEETIEYPDEGELLVIRRVLSAQPTTEELEQRENLFHSRCTIKDKVCHLIIDSGSCTNIASVTLVEKLGLETTKHPRPYKLKWLNDKEEIKVSKQVEIPFSIGQYQDQLMFDVAPMQAGHILLGRPWQYDREVSHHGRSNQYSFCLNQRKFTLAPLEQKEVREMQARAKVSSSTKLSFYIDKSIGFSQNMDMMHLSWPRDKLSGFKDKDAQRNTKSLEGHVPTLDLQAARGVYSSIWTQTEPFQPPSKPEPKPYHGKTLNSQKRMSINLLSLGADVTVSRTKLLEEGGYDVGTRTKTHEKLSSPSIELSSASIRPVLDQGATHIGECNHLYSFSSALVLSHRVLQGKVLTRQVGLQPDGRDITLPTTRHDPKVLLRSQSLSGSAHDPGFKIHRPTMYLKDFDRSRIPESRTYQDEEHGMPPGDENQEVTSTMEQSAREKVSIFHIHRTTIYFNDFYRRKTYQDRVHLEEDRLNPTEDKNRRGRLTRSSFTRAFCPRTSFHQEKSYKETFDREKIHHYRAGLGFGTCDSNLMITDRPKISEPPDRIRDDSLLFLLVNMKTTCCFEAPKTTEPPAARHKPKEGRTFLILLHTEILWFLMRGTSNLDHPFKQGDPHPPINPRDLLEISDPIFSKLILLPNG